MDSKILKVKGFNLLLIFLISIQLILFLMTSLLFVFSSIADESLITVISAFSFILISVPISYVLYKSCTENPMKNLFFTLSITLIILSISAIIGGLLPFTYHYSFLLPIAFLIMIISFVPIAVGLLKIYWEQKSRLGKWIKLLIFYVDIIFILVLLYFVLTNKVFTINSYDIIIYTMVTILDIIIISLSMILILIYMPVKLRYFFSIVFCFYVLSFIGDVLKLMSFFYDLDIFQHYQFFYDMMFMFMSFALLIYALSNIKMTTVEEMNKKLEDTTLVIEDLIIQSPESMCMCDINGTIIKANDSYINIFNLNRDVTIKNLNIFNYDFNLKGINQDFSKVKSGEIINIDSAELYQENSLKYLSIKIFPTYSTDKKITYYIMNVEDITLKKNSEKALINAYADLETRVQDRTAELSVLNDALQNEIHEHKIDEEKIKASLKEKEVLLKEIHHRVKNNMQIISSMLGLQSSLINDAKLNEIFKDGQNRIRSMALIHEKLYRSENMANVDFSEYVSSLSMNLITSYSRDVDKILFNLNVEKTSFNIDLSIPLGLIINELVSNSLKHAFPDNKKGEIFIEIKKIIDNQYQMIVKDNGIGLNKEFDIDECKSLGLQLVNILVNQIDADMTITIENGTCYTIKFKSE